MHRTEEEIKRDMLNNISNTEDKTENSFIHDALAVASIEFFQAARELESVGNKIDIENLEGRELERFIFQRTGLKRKLATFSTTEVIISGTEGTRINKGDLVGSDEVDFEVLEEIVIGQSGKARVKVRSLLEGSSGNVPINSINRFPNAINGLVDVYNPDAVVNGYDEESDRIFIDRYYEKLQRPAKAGNKYHYEQWAKEVVGVGGVKVIPRWDGPLSVKVIIIDSNGLPASEDLVANTFSHIEEERPFGANVTVVSASSKEINISVNLILKEGLDDLVVKEEIKNKVSDYLSEIAFTGKSVSYARIGCIIFDIESVLDYTDLRVNLGTSNIELANEEVAVIGGVS